MSAAASWKATVEGDIAENQNLIQYRVARGGPALIINGGVSVHATGRLGPASSLFDDDCRIPSFKRFASMIHKNGADTAFQLAHSGIWAGAYQKKVGSWPFAPSFLINDALGEYRSKNREPFPATEEQIKEVIRAYGNAASRAKMAGYDAVEVHAAHESALSQFLSPETNIRDDDWGGPIENRCRLHCEILTEIRRNAGCDFPVIIKLGVKDGWDGGLSLEDGIAAARIISSGGDVDAIEVSQGLSGSATNFDDTSMKMGITRIEEEGYYRAWTKRVKSSVEDEIVVIMQGGLRSFELMEEVVRRGEADLVSMCRPYLRETALVNRWMSGDRRKAACVSCNKCVIGYIMEGKPLTCRLGASADK